MDVLSYESPHSSFPACVLLVPLWKDLPLEESLEISLGPSAVESVEGYLRLEKTAGKAGERRWLYPITGEQSLLLIGLGTKEEFEKRGATAQCEFLRRAYGSALRYCLMEAVGELFLFFPGGVKDEHRLAAFEGASLANYRFHCKKEDPPPRSLRLRHGLSSHLDRQLRELLLVSDAVHFVQDLVNGNADDVHPGTFAELAAALHAEYPQLSYVDLDLEALKREGMGLIVAVGRAGCVAPRCIVLSHKGAPDSPRHTVFVGKGVCYDTGGLCLKPSSSMMTMRSDMAGAAVVLGIMRVLVQLQLPLNVSVVIAAAENGIGSQSFKLGDVYMSMEGLSVEIANTDAEGRLLLADAFTYARRRLQPTEMIDIATLTGAVVNALGGAASGLFTDDDRLAELLWQAGELTGERLCRLPLYEEYEEELQSDIADLRNVGNSMQARGQAAALFLRRFTGDIPWAHLDIAGTAFGDKEKGYLPKSGTGVGVRLLWKYLRGVARS